MHSQTPGDEYSYDVFVQADEVYHSLLRNGGAWGLRKGKPYILHGRPPPGAYFLEPDVKFAGARPSDLRAALARIIGYEKEAERVRAGGLGS